MRALIVAALISASDGFRVPRKAAVTATSRNACGAKGNSSGIQIVNGQQADECEWKWQVALVTREGRLPFCGGMLVAADWVLTAAHCISGGTFQVMAGVRNPTYTSFNQQVRGVETIHKHYSWDMKTIDHDFAMVKLSSPMDLTGCVGTVCLPTSDVPAGSTCWISGWGTLNSGGKQPDILQEAPVNILSNAQCTETGYGDRITDAMLCAQGQTAKGGLTGACQGDSGGPLVCENDGVWTVHGATSWSSGCAEENYPTVWARIFYVRDWVASILDGTMTTPPPPTCPSFAHKEEPDGYGDCRCPYFHKCSKSGGAEWDCSSNGGYGGSWFPHDCKDCQCYKCSGFC